MIKTISEMCIQSICRRCVLNLNLLSLCKTGYQHYESQGQLKGSVFFQSTASEATLVALLSARTRQIHKIKGDNPNQEDGIIMSKFVAYCSDQVIA